MSTHLAPQLDAAACAIAEAECLIITAGAGMGVDSGLPDFRGDSGLYGSLGLLHRHGLSVYEAANPAFLDRDPRRAWGFMATLWQTFRDAVPHAGFEVLRQWAAAREHFVFTSNVDGQFQKAGFAPERIVECHGSVHFLQPHQPASFDDTVWPTDGLAVEVDPETLEARGELPRAPDGSRLARLNVLMFGDFWWIPTRAAQQEMMYLAWLEEVRGARCAIVELGAGTALPTVRCHSETLCAGELPHATLIRINPHETAAPPGAIVLPMGAREALVALGERTATSA